jgi:hypothetical protein
MATFLCCSRNPSAHVTDADRPRSALRVCSVPKPATTYIDSAPRLVPCVRTAIAADRLRLGVRQLPRTAAVRDGGQRLVARSRRPHVRPAGRSGSVASVRRTVPLSSVSTRSTLVGEYHEYHPRRCFRPPSQLRADTHRRVTRCGRLPLFVRVVRGIRRGLLRSLSSNRHHPAITETSATVESAAEALLSALRPVGSSCPEGPRTPWARRGVGQGHCLRRPNGALCPPSRCYY